MKKRFVYLTLLFIAVSVLFSCSKDDDTERGYKFKDQIMQGEIEGDNWVFASGTAEIDYWDEDQLSLMFYAEASDDPCNEFLSGNKVMCTIPNAVGLYKLNFNFSGDNIQTVTLFHEASVMNTVASEGAIEIMLIDLQNGIIEGRIDAYGDKNDFVNGNFSLSYCEDNK